MLPCPVAKCHHQQAQSRTLDLVNDQPDWRQAVAALAGPAHAGERGTGSVAAVLDRGALEERSAASLDITMCLSFASCTDLGPSPVTFLDDLGDGPALGLFALEHVLDHHGRGEGRGDVEDLEVAGITESAMSFRAE